MNELQSQIERNVKRCNIFFVPKVGDAPLKDPQCVLDYSHVENHLFDETKVDNVS